MNRGTVSRPVLSCPISWLPATKLVLCTARAISFSSQTLFLLYSICLSIISIFKSYGPNYYIISSGSLSLVMVLKPQIFLSNIIQHFSVEIFAGVTILLSQTVFSLLVGNVITKTSEAVPLLGTSKITLSTNRNS